LIENHLGLCNSTRGEGLSDLSPVQDLCMSSGSHEDDDSFWNDLDCRSLVPHRPTTVQQVTNILSTRTWWLTHSFIHSGHLYSTSSSPLLLRGAPNTAWILCRSL